MVNFHTVWRVGDICIIGTAKDDAEAEDEVGARAAADADRARPAVHLTSYFFT